MLIGPTQINLRLHRNREDRLLRIEDRIFLLATDPVDGITRLDSLHDDS